MVDFREPKYKSIVLAFDGVIIPNRYSACSDYEAKHDLPKGSVKAAMETELKEIREDVPEEEMARRLVSCLTSNSNNNLGSADVLQLMRSASCEPYAHTHEVLQVLWAAGIKLVLAVNNWKTESEKKTLDSLREYSSWVVESAVIKQRMPSSDFYEHIKQQLGISSDDVIYVDCDDKNVEAAKNAGFVTLKVDCDVPSFKEIETALQFPLRSQAEDPDLPGHHNIKLNLLAKFLQDELKLHQEDPPAIRHFDSALVNPIYHVTYGGQEMVLKGAMSMLASEGVIRQYRVMKALQDTDVPVPKIYGLCTDNSILGSPFFLMEYVKGRIFVNQSLPGMKPAERKAVFLAMTDTLNKLHQVDVDAVGLGDLSERNNFYRRFIDTYVQQYRNVNDTPIEDADRLIEWLQREENQPNEESLVLVHGDYRMNNMVFHESKPEVVAILDWEYTTLGDQFYDLGYLCGPPYAFPNSRTTRPVPQPTYLCASGKGHQLCSIRLLFSLDMRSKTGTNGFCW
ncbi:acyl-CoA dehydrogenase family member 10 isoform X2 [Nematostella vectensis]|uniref:acyl-CoA dehydrogenase family member 10 isoform X2 n=1 Tax=Nematostella vectensis TaxID=45351 RepID=UPI00138FBDD1|nr:acyl-CoA dehydrogenase family member 10 isoform X2 [Nematostella vectensis]